MIDFKNIKVGDKVLISSRYRDNYIDDVTKIGKTFIQVKNLKFSNTNGSIKPYQPMSDYIVKIAEEHDFKTVANQLKRKKVRNYFTNLSLYEKCSDEIITKLDTIISEIK